MGYEKMVVIFIDIVGSRDITGFEKKYAIHRLFHSSVRESQERQASDSHSHVAYDRKLFSFSDCAYITYFHKPGLPAEKRSDEQLLHVALFNTSILALRLARHGYRVRGGVTLDDAFVDSDGCFGPAINEAYRLESKDANYPRILLSEEAGKLQHDFETRNQSEESVALMNKLVRDWTPRIVNQDDEDKRFYLNIFYMLEMERALSYDGDEFTLEDVRDVLMEKIQDERIQHQNDKRKTEQIEWFASYLSRAKCSLRTGQYSYSTTL